MRSTAKAAGTYFLLLMGAGFAFGAARVMLVEPRIGTRAAELLEMPLMLAAMVMAATWVVRHFALAPGPAPRLLAGFGAVFLMLAAEVALVLPLRGGTPASYLESLDPVTATAFYGLLFFAALLPLLVGRGRAVAVGIAVLVSVAALAIGLAFRHDLREAHARVAAGSRIAHTACGPIEFAEAGQGPAILMVHGSGGGYDQGMAFAEPLNRAGFRVVAMSRFGYLRTPMPADASPAAQADAHVCLMDKLGISAATVVGASAGAPSAMQLALRHPRRVSALFLLVPLAYAPREPAAAPPAAARWMLERAVGSDFVYWSVLNVAPDAIVATLLATPPEAVARAHPSERERVTTMMREIMPLGPRQAGLVNEARIAGSLGRYDLERISVPTVALSVADDRYGTYEGARYTAGAIPGARFVGYEAGGHVWVGHHEAVLAEIAALAGLVAP